MRLICPLRYIHKTLKKAFRSQIIGFNTKLKYLHSHDTQLKDIVYVVQFTQFKLEHFLKRQTKNLVWPI